MKTLQLGFVDLIFGDSFWRAVVDAGPWIPDAEIEVEQYMDLHNLCNDLRERWE